MSGRILIATLGSLGDLHPCLALALELQGRGHRVTIASTEWYREKVEALGIPFRAMRPNWNPTDREMIRQCEDMRRGPEVLFRKLVLPELRGTYEDLAAAATDADVLIAGEIVFAAPLVAEKLGLRWVSAILSPCSFLSAYDPSVLVSVPGLTLLRGAGQVVNRAVLELGRRGIQHWWEPVRELRRELHLSTTDCDPLFRDKFSPHLVLALFSRWLAKPQPDWPAQTIQPGFAFYDEASGVGPAAELRDFLASGEAPIVFTLGSTAVHYPGDFYDVSIAAARRLRRRALLLGAPVEAASGDAPDVLALTYAAYSQVFPHAAAVVHQGGSGTTGQALRGGRPMLIVPFGWDQPDNAARVERLGAGLTLSRASYTAKAATHALDRLLNEPRFAASAVDAARTIADEDATPIACDAVEALLASADRVQA